MADIKALPFPFPLDPTENPMPRVIYNAPYADPQMDGLEWTLDRGELISPELTEAQVARYLTIPGFRQVEPPAPPAEPVKQPEPAPVAPAPAEPPADAPPAAPTEPPADPAAKPPAARTRGGAQKPATDAGAAGEPQKE